MATELEFNKLMNIIDPPKDLKILGLGNKNLHEYSDALKPILIDLFLGTSNDAERIAKVNELRANITYMKYKPVADDKQIIKDRIDAAYRLTGAQKDTSRMLEIVREKQSTGHNPKPDIPSGYYLAQDCGSMNVVVNPTILHTPGSILDPAGKTKGADVQQLFDGEYATLPLKYIQGLGLDTCINGPITMVTNETSFEISIPTSIQDPQTKATSTVVGKFSKRTFEPIEDDPYTIYFEGNEKKNANIYDILAHGELATKKYSIDLLILMKELGDTLQVQWLNHIFAVDNGGKPWKRENTLMATSDTVVCYRSIVNNIGSVLTTGKKATIYLPVSEVAKALLTTTFIDSIRIEVVSANASVIQTILDVINTGRFSEDGRPGGTLWINKMAWNNVQFRNALDFLKHIITRLESFNNDLNGILKKIRDLESAKAVAAKNRLQCPFVYYVKERYYKTVNSSNQIFNVIRMKSPSTFNLERDDVYMSVRIGIQAGGSWKPSKNRKQRGGSMMDYLQVATDPVDKRIIEKVDQEHVSNNNLRGELSVPARRGRLSAFQNAYIANVDSFATLNNGQMFIFVRDHIPELFTYGCVLSTAMDTPIVQLQEDAFFTPDQYFWNTNNRIQYTIIPNAQVVSALYTYTKSCIKFADLYCKLFPQFLTSELELFFGGYFTTTRYDRFSLEHGPANIPTVSDTDMNLSDSSQPLFSSQQYGGGGIPTNLTGDKWSNYLDFISTVAIDLYEQNFYLRMKAAYEDRDSIDVYLQEREDVIEYYRQNLTDDDYLLKYELKLFEQDYMRITGTEHVQKQKQPRVSVSGPTNKQLQFIQKTGVTKRRRYTLQPISLNSNTNTNLSSLNNSSVARAYTRTRRARATRKTRKISKQRKQRNQRTQRTSRR